MCIYIQRTETAIFDSNTNKPVPGTEKISYLIFVGGVCRFICYSVEDIAGCLKLIEKEKFEQEQTEQSISESDNFKP